MTAEALAKKSSRRRFLITAGAIITAGAVVVLFVLPAETGIDLTGFGTASGLSDMANPGAVKTLERGRLRKGVFTPGDVQPGAEAGPRDHWEFELKPFEEIELKYVIDRNGPIAFKWTATAPLNFDMHAHPFDGGDKVTESYAIDKADTQSGRYVAAFSGIHGWHWQNRSLETVHLSLDASGSIKGSKLFDASGEHERQLTPTAR